MSPMELDGHLTGIVVSPDLLLPSRWLHRIWGENEPTFDTLDQMQTVIAAVMSHHNALIAALDAGFKQIEAKRNADYRPLYLAVSGKPTMTSCGPGCAASARLWRLRPNVGALLPKMNVCSRFLCCSSAFWTSQIQTSNQQITSTNS
jgi:hypothetical protein